ncbi:MAG: AMP-binding protein [Acidobacteriota bacterium]
MIDPTPHLERFESYEQACREFRWVIPEHFNIASAICRKHADAVTRIALNEVKEAGTNTYTFAGLDFLSDKFAMALSESGINQGDSVAVILPQSASLAVAHLGALKTGAVVVPLPMVSDAALLEHALADSSAKAVVVDESIYARVETSRNLPNLESHFVVRDLRPEAPDARYRDFWSEVDRASSDFDVVEADANSSAFIFYVESQGKPAGVVHSHRSVIGNLTAFQMFSNLECEGDSVFWAADDWSSPGPVLGMLYPAWWSGCSVVAAASEDCARPLPLIERCEVTHAFIPSPQLMTPAESEPEPRERLELKLRTLVSDGPLSPPMLDWAKDKLGVTLTEVYGKPETGWVVGGCERWFATRVGSAGRAAPGRSIEIIDDSGSVLTPGKTGRVAVHKSDPALFTEFHNAADRTAASFIGDWFLTGDSGYKSEDGDLFIHHPHA